MVKSNSVRPQEEETADNLPRPARYAHSAAFLEKQAIRMHERAIAAPKVPSTPKVRKQDWYRAASAILALAPDTMTLTWVNPLYGAKPVSRYAVQRALDLLWRVEARVENLIVPLPPPTAVLTKGGSVCLSFAFCGSAFDVTVPTGPGVRYLLEGDYLPEGLPKSFAAIPDADLNQLLTWLTGQVLPNLGANKGPGEREERP